MKIQENTTICAPATLPGTGAISLLRVSGPDCLAIADQVIRLRKGTLAEAAGYSLHFGEIYETSTGATLPANEVEGENPMEGQAFVDERSSHDGLLDEVLVSVFRAPRSYTGEDMVEISCHASAFIVERILSLLCQAGASPAEPGEFTRRAFLNGKMDLSQAEAVADVIASGSRSAHRLAMNQMKGGYSAELGRIRDELLHLASLMELELDFSEEDVEFANRSDLGRLLDKAIDHCTTLADSFRVGDALKNGIPTAIVGAPNSGKSTLLNALCGQDRAIVSPIAGTTRDTIEETCVIDGLLFRFIDTAGIRQSDEAIEKLGIERSYQALAHSRVALVVLDLSRPDDELLIGMKEMIQRMSDAPESDPTSPSSVDFASVGSRIDRTHASEKPELVIILNKADLEPSAVRIADLKDRLKALAPDADMLVMSLLGTSESREADTRNLAAPKTGTPGRSTAPADAQAPLAIDDLLALKRLLGSRFKALADRTDTLVTNLRHANALCEAAGALIRTRDSLAARIPTDLCCTDLREALHHLGTITGQITTQDVLNNIFSRFCIGK